MAIRGEKHKTSRELIWRLHCKRGEDQRRMNSMTESCSSIFGAVYARIVSKTSTVVFQDLFPHFWQMVFSHGTMILSLILEGSLMRKSKGVQAHPQKLAFHNPKHWFINFMNVVFTNLQKTFQQAWNLDMIILLFSILKIQQIWCIKFLHSKACFHQTLILSHAT